MHNKINLKELFINENRRFLSTGGGLTLNLQHKSVAIFTLSPFILGIEAFLLGTTITTGGIIGKKWLSSSDVWAPACLTTTFSLITLFVIAFYASKAVTAFKRFRKNPPVDDYSNLYQDIDLCDSTFGDTHWELYYEWPLVEFDPTKCDVRSSFRPDADNTQSNDSNCLGLKDTSKRPLPSNHIEVDNNLADELKKLHKHLDGR